MYRKYDIDSNIVLMEYT